MRSRIRSKVPVFLLMAAVALSSFPVPAYGLLGVDIGGISSGVITTIIETVEERYHLDRYSVQDYGEGLNISSNKGNVPEVSLVFSPSDPREGEKLTARAFPVYFSNSTDQLYYTWYLKRNGCDLGGGSGVPEYCDADDDGSVTVNDWKVAAMRILVTDGADKRGFEYDGDDDDDGYQAKHGGEMEVSVNPGHKYCGAYDAETGKIMEFEEKGDCFHVFPDTDGAGTTGDGRFDLAEESFWGSNPHDPDTSDNGNKDEANAVGLGLDSFTWNYLVGDQVGVIVEGTSMVPTQHEDSSYMIMWAFSQNIRPALSSEEKKKAAELCSPRAEFLRADDSPDAAGCSLGSVTKYTEEVKGYDVCFLEVEASAGDYDGCLEANLVDPLEGGQGKSKKLDLSVSASPENPTNDRKEMIAGDILSVNASVSNSSRSSNEIRYDWIVLMSDDPVDGFVDVTKELSENGLIPAASEYRFSQSDDEAVSVSGNGLDSFWVSLNMSEGLLDELGAFGSDDPLYLKVAVEARENFGGRVARVGRSDVVARVANTDRKIAAYAAEISFASGEPRLTVGSGDPICDEYEVIPGSEEQISSNLDRIACRLSRYEIVGLKVDSDELENFRWTINGTPLACTKEVSDDQSCHQIGNEVFFAAAGNPGETYSVRMDAVEVDTGKTVSLSRTFQVVEPGIVIGSADESQTWAQYVGEFTELDGFVFSDYSDEVFEMHPDGTISLRAETVPGHVARRLTSFGWSVDGMEIDGEYDAANGQFVLRYAPGIPKDDGEQYFVDFSGTHAFPNEYRLALDRIFGIDALATSDYPLEREVRIRVVSYEPFAGVPGKGTDFFATVSRHVPSYAVLAFRMFASAALILFTVGFVFSLMPEASSAGSERRRYDT